MLSISLSVSDDSDEVIELNFEHSLISLSKWEQKYKKPFFGKNKEEKKSPEESAYYIKCMLITENAPVGFLNQLKPEQIHELMEYMNDKQTATWFREDPKQRPSAEIVTSELVYYWLVQFGIPFEVETWHLNRLLTLVKICSIKQTKPKKMSKAQQAEEFRRLNAERRAASGSSG